MKRSALRSTLGTLLFGVSLQLHAQTLAITVTNLNDSGPGSLRQAIADTPAGGTIDFGVPGTIVLTSGQLVITNDLTVNGPGTTNLTLSQSSANRIFVVSNGIVSISGLTIANGRCLGYEVGGGIWNLATLTLRKCLIVSNYTANCGGGIFNQATLVVRDCLITANTAFELGGGVDNAGAGSTTTIIGSTVCSNTTIDQFWGGGAGVDNDGHLVLSNSTVSCNNQRCGVLHWAGTIVVSSSTLANNQAGDLVFNPRNPSINVTLRNSIITACAGGIITSEDYNLIQASDGVSFVGATNHNIYGQDPKLGPLADNGGPTPTHALRFDSPAIDSGHSGGAATDQRGLPRPVDDPNIPSADGGDGCDIGAYESDPNLKITGFEAAGAEVQVGFNSVLGRNYRLESEGNLDNSWTTLSNNIAGTGSANQTLNAGATSLPRQFYRLKLLP